MPMTHKGLEALALRVGVLRPTVESTECVREALLVLLNEVAALRRRVTELEREV